MRFISLFFPLPPRTLSFAHRQCVNSGKRLLFAFNMRMHTLETWHSPFVTRNHCHHSNNNNNKSLQIENGQLTWFVIRPPLLPFKSMKSGKIHTTHSQCLYLRMGMPRDWIFSAQGRRENSYVRHWSGSLAFSSTIHELNVHISSLCGLQWTVASCEMRVSLVNAMLIWRISYKSKTIPINHI